jgi:hypothetical protein
MLSSVRFPTVPLLGLGLAASLPLPCLRAADEVNLLRNPGFEDGAASWWGEGLTPESVVGEAPAQGSQCLKLASGYACQDKIPVTGGQRYKLSLKIRAENAPAGSIYVQLSYRGGGLEPGWYGPAAIELEGRREKALFTHQESGGQWTTYSAVVQAPAKADQMLVYLRKIPGTPGHAYFDELTAVATEEAASKPPGPKLPPDGQVTANGGFEDGFTGWWGEGVGKDNIERAQPAAEGAASLRITGGFACQDKRPVEGGKRYRVSMRIRAEGAAEGSAYVQISYRGADLSGGWFGPDLAKVEGRKEKALFVTGGTHGWQEFSRVVAPPAGADEILVYLRKAKSEGTVYYDQVSILPTDDPETTAAGLLREKLAAEWLRPDLPAEQAAALLEQALAAGREKTAERHALAKAGQALVRVHVGTGEDLLALNAAHDLAEHLGKISGGDFLPLSHDRHPVEGPLLIVGRDNALASQLLAGVDLPALGPDGFVIRSAGRHLVIAGNTPGGTMYGVNWFLDHRLGVRWLSPDYTYLPSSPDLEVAAGEERQVPRFNFRQLLSVEGQDKRFAARNLMNGNSHGAQSIISPPEINHWDNSWQPPGLTASFYDLMPPKTYQGQHPHWFAGGQVAMMNPEVRKHMAQAIVKRLKTRADYRDYWFGFMDNDWGWDMDPASAKFAKAHGDSPAAPRTDMAMEVAKLVREQLPEARIAFNAYHWSFTPPTGIQVPPNVLVFPMTIHVDYSSPLNTGRNTQLGQDIEGWNRAAENVLLWDHVTNFHGYIQPTPNIYPIGESIHWLASLKNVHGYFAEGSWNTPGAEFSSLRVWLMARMLWAPETDVRAAVADYCRAYYGPAGDLVRQYIDLMHAEAQRTKAATWEKTNVDSPLLNFDFVTKADALLREAEKLATGNPVHLRHLRQVQVTLDYVVLLRRQEFESEAARRGLAWSAETDPRRQRLEATIKEEKISQYRQGGGVAELRDLIQVERKTSTPPPVVKGLAPADWKEIQDLGFNRYYKSTIIVPDAAASDGAAARLDGKSGAWVIQAKLHLVPEEGLWDIYAEVRVEAEDAADSDGALAIGSAPPMNRFTTVPYREVKGDGYHLVKVPGGPFRYDQGDGAITYLRGAESKKVKYVYVDRFIMVRAREGSASAK